LEPHSPQMNRSAVIDFIRWLDAALRWVYSLFNVRLISL
jgi:hypothetical protein